MATGTVEDGTVTRVSAGATTITVTCGSVKTSCKVTMLGGEASEDIWATDAELNYSSIKSRTVSVVGAVNHNAVKLTVPSTVQYKGKTFKGIKSAARVYVPKKLTGYYKLFIKKARVIGKY